MGRQLESQDSEIEFQMYHPGCIWSLFNILDHHHLRDLKKWQPRRKHGRAKRAIGCTNPETVSFEHFPEEVHEYLDAEAVPLLVEQECSPPCRISSNSPVKALVTEEMSARSLLNRSSSIHHLESLDDQVATGSANWANPIIILHRSADDSKDFFKQEQKNITTHSHSSEKSDRLEKGSLNHNLLGFKHLGRGISCPQFDYMDVLEILKVNKKLLMEIQEDPDIEVEKQLRFRTNANLKISGSFPAPVSSKTSPVRPITLEHKQKEVWYFPKGEKLSPGIQAPEIYSQKASKDSFGKSQVLKADTSEEALDSHDRNLPSSAFSQGSHKHGWPHWHHSVTTRIKYIRRKIKHVLKESRKENNHTSRNAVHQRVPVGSEFFTEETDLDDTLEITSERAGAETVLSSHETKGFDDAPIRSTQRNMRTSLDESMDRYTRLFESNISKETKWSQYQSKSLKLTNEDKTARSGNGLKSFRRRFSMSDLDSLVSFPYEVFRDAFSSELPKGCYINDNGESHNELNSSRNHLGGQQYEPTNVFEETRPQEGALETLADVEGISKTFEVDNSVAESEKLEQKPRCSEEICSDNMKEPELDTHFQDYAAAAAELLKTENLNVEQMNTGESDYSVAGEDLSCRDSAGGFQNIANRECDENATIIAENHLLPFEFRQDDSDFNYVRNVLEVAGFIEENCLGKWHSLDQPMSSTLFKELEDFLDGQCSSGDTNSYCNHRLLFDLINEQLHDIHKGSLAYFPKPFSFTTRRFKPPPKGNHLVEEVWKRINMYQQSYTEEQSLDDFVARDLAKHDGWMNLPLHVEDVALDLEDLMFDDLLDEVICS